MDSQKGSQTLSLAEIIYDVLTLTSHKAYWNMMLAEMGYDILSVKVEGIKINFVHPEDPAGMGLTPEFHKAAKLLSELRDLIDQADSKEDAIGKIEARIEKV